MFPTWWLFTSCLTSGLDSNFIQQFCIIYEFKLIQIYTKQRLWLITIKICQNTLVQAFKLHFIHVILQKLMKTRNCHFVDFNGENSHLLDLKWKQSSFMQYCVVFNFSFFVIAICICKLTLLSYFENWF